MMQCKLSSNCSISQLTDKAGQTPLTPRFTSTFNIHTKVCDLQQYFSTFCTSSISKLCQPLHCQPLQHATQPCKHEICCNLLSLSQCMIWHEFTCTPSFFRTYVP